MCARLLQQLPYVASCFAHYRSSHCNRRWHHGKSIRPNSLDQADIEGKGALTYEQLKDMRLYVHSCCSCRVSRTS